MTVSSSTSRSGPYAGAGQTGPFTVTFRFLEDSHLRVTRTTAGVETVLTLATDYSVTGAGSPSGGTLTLVVALAVSSTLTIDRAVPITQLTDYTQSDAFPAESHENALDKLTMIAQQVNATAGSAIRVPETITTLPPLPSAATRALKVLTFDASGNPSVSTPASGSAVDVLNQLAGTGSAQGATLVGLYDPSDYFAATTANNTFAELGLRNKKLVDVSGYPWLADMTGVTDSTAAVRLAEVYAASIGAGLYIPAGTLTASISGRRNNFSVLGAGKSVTTVKLPATTFAITSVSRAGTGVVTVVCSSTAAMWADLGIKLTGIADATFNNGYVITTIDSPTQFKCQREGGSTVVASSSSGVVSYASAIEAGQCAMGNSATAYTGLTVRDLTIDGNKANRAAVTGDLTDWGLPITAWSNLDIDVWAKSCHNGGVGAFINANRGHITCWVDACGNATYTGVGFDLNSSKYLVCDVVSTNCYDGSRVLDNCWGVIGRFSNFNSTRHGFIHQNQAVNESHTNRFDVTVHTVGTHGIIVAENSRGFTMNASVHGAGGIGCVINDGSVAANRPSGFTLNLTTRNSQSQGLLCYGDDCTIVHKSRLDGRAGAAGSSYAVDIYGNRGTYDLNVFDSGTPQVRGVVMRAGATDNEITTLVETGVVSTFSDSGTRTQVPKYRGATQSIASAGTIVIPPLGSFFLVTGTTNITSANVPPSGRIITLQFAGALTFTDGGVLTLAGNFVTTADDTITLVSTGTNLVEIARSVN